MTGGEIAVIGSQPAKVITAAFSRDGLRAATSSADGTVRLWDAHIAMMSAKELVVEVCTRRLRGLTMLNRDEMRLAGYPDITPQIDVCAGVDGG